MAFKSVGSTIRYAFMQAVGLVITTTRVVFDTNKSELCGRLNLETTSCAFCKISNGEVSARLVFEDEISLAFLDLRPVFPGHCLLIPKLHYETLADLPKELIEPLFANTQLLARAVETGMQAHGTFVAMNNRVSQSVPHLHVHVVPRRRKDGLRGFFWPRYPYQSDEEADAVQQAIRSAVDGLRQ